MKRKRTPKTKWMKNIRKKEMTLKEVMKNWSKRKGLMLLHRLNLLKILQKNRKLRDVSKGLWDALRK